MNVFLLKVYSKLGSCRKFNQKWVLVKNLFKIELMSKLHSKFSLCRKLTHYWIRIENSFKFEFVIKIRQSAENQGSYISFFASEEILLFFKNTILKEKRLKFFKKYLTTSCSALSSILSKGI